jgi:hypothetical protein
MDQRGMVAVLRNLMTRAGRAGKGARQVEAAALSLDLNVPRSKRVKRTDPSESSSDLPCVQCARADP